MFKHEEGETNRRVSTASARLRGLVLGWGSWGSVSLPICSGTAGACRLQKLQKDIETAARTEDHHLQVLRESEALLQAKRAELDKLRSQVCSSCLENQFMLLESLHSCCDYKNDMCLIVEETGKYIVKYE